MDRLPQKHIKEKDRELSELKVGEKCYISTVFTGKDGHIYISKKELIKNIPTIFTLGLLKREENGWEVKILKSKLPLSGDNIDASDFFNPSFYIKADRIEIVDGIPSDLR
jgi:hypothetical protein